LPTAPNLSYKSKSTRRELKFEPRSGGFDAAILELATSNLTANLNYGKFKF
jgi:hypothetical protein